MLASEEYKPIEQTMRTFFVRNLPKLAVHLYNILIGTAVLSGTAGLYDQPKEREELFRAIIKRMIRDLESDIKRMLGTRKRGGSQGRLDTNTRQSFHTWYSDLHAFAKPVKKHYDSMAKDFDESRKRRGYAYEEWQRFWANHAEQFYGYNDDGNREFYSLFAEPGMSASDVAYTWIARKTGYSFKYTKRLVLDSRKKVTMKR